jgi:hypothetical protein
VADDVGVSVPNHMHRLAPMSHSDSYRCDMCNESDRPGRQRCVAGCDWDACGTCVIRYGHKGEWRGPERSRWCSTERDTDGMQCTHGAAITTGHWSCCGETNMRAGRGCYASEVVFWWTWLTF